MAELADFLEIPKTDSFNDLLTGMRYSSYANWSGFAIPGFRKDKDCNDFKILSDYKFYTDLKISGDKDIQNLFYMSVSEAKADNVKILYGGIDFALHQKCENSEKFINAIEEIKKKSGKSTELRPILIINSEAENNLPLAETFIKNQNFSGIILSGANFFLYDSNVKIYEKIFSTARKLNQKTEINCTGIKTPDETKSALETFLPDFLKDIREEICDEKTLDFMKQTEMCAEFSPYSPFISSYKKQKRYKFIRRLFDYGIKIHLCTGNLLFLKKSISEFAADLCNSGLFSNQEMISIIKTDYDAKKSLND